jgi:hypothetical protein
MSLLWRHHKKEEVKEPVREEPVSVDEEVEQYPKHVGGGWYELSNGERVQGKEEAIEAEKGG